MTAVNGPSTTPPIGLPKRYRDVRPMTQGGMGKVFLATDSETQQAVAIKIPRTDTRLASTRLQERFDREQRVIEALSHPNIVDVLEIGRTGEQLFIATEYVEGTDLRGLLSERSLSVKKARRILGQVCSAVGYLHEQGILHRDLQPGNILLGEDDLVKVTDFGLAVPIEDLGVMTQTGEVMGTVDFMSPEQRHQLPTDERSDQYSIGAIAYEMLTGRRPAGLFPPPSEANPDIPRAIDGVVMRALHRDPKERFSSVESFASAFQLAVDARARPSFTRIGALVGVLAAVAIAIFFGWDLLQPGGGDRPTGKGESGSARGDGFNVPGPLSTALGNFKTSKSTKPPPAVADSSQGAIKPGEVESLQKQWSEHLGLPSEISNSLGMRFSLIPPGKFVMGTSSDEIQSILAMEIKHTSYWAPRLKSEIPEHTVTISRPFYLGTMKCESVTSRSSRSRRSTSPGQKRQALAEARGERNARSTGTTTGSNKRRTIP